MRDIAYAVRGFLTVRRDSLRVPLSGRLTVHEDPSSGLFTGDLVLRESTIRRRSSVISAVSRAGRSHSSAKVRVRISLALGSWRASLFASVNEWIRSARARGPAPAR